MKYQICEMKNGEYRIRYKYPFFPFWFWEKDFYYQDSWEYKFHSSFAEADEVIKEKKKEKEDRKNSKIILFKSRIR